MTAVGAKGCGILLQILAIPYAVRVLGVETYGVYATAAALFAWLSLLEVGIGANLVKSMVSAIARGDEAGTGRLFQMGFGVITILAWSLAMLALGGMWAWGTIHETRGLSEVMPLFAVAAVLAALQLSTAAVTRTRAALQQTHINNLYGAAANLVSALLLLLLVKPGMSSVTLLLALNGPLVLAQILNGSMLLARHSGWLTRAGIDWAQARDMLCGGSWLALAQAGVFLQREAPKLILAAVTTAAMVGHYACAVQVLMIMAGLVVMISTPLMPAVADAIERGEHLWWQKRVGLILVAVAVLGLLLGGIMALAGPRLISLAFGESMQFTVSESVGLIAWGTAVLLSHVLYTVLVAAGNLRSVAFWQLAEGIIIVVLFAALHAVVGLGGMFWLSSLVTLLVTFLPWGFRVRRLARNTAG
jgi:O-antigen/teichoic acid export membrane protein